MKKAIKMTVMMPTVVNVDGPSQSVATKQNEELPVQDDDILLPDIEPDK